MTDFDSFDFEPSDRYYIIKDQFGKECWYDPNTEKMTPLEDDFVPFGDYLKSQGKVLSDSETKRSKLDDEPSLN